MLAPALLEVLRRQSGAVGPRSVLPSPFFPLYNAVCMCAVIVGCGEGGRRATAHGVDRVVAVAAV